MSELVSTLIVLEDPFSAILPAIFDLASPAVLEDYHLSFEECSIILGEFSMTTL